MEIIETKSHYEVIVILNYVNLKFGTKHTKHDFGGGKVKFVAISEDGSVTYLKTFKSAAKLGKSIQTFTEFANNLVLQIHFFKSQIEMMHKEAQTISNDRKALKVY